MKTIKILLQLFISSLATLVVASLLFTGQFIFALVIFFILCLHLVIQSTEGH